MRPTAKRTAQVDRQALAVRGRDADGRAARRARDHGGPRALLHVGAHDARGRLGEHGLFLCVVGIDEDAQY
jgi:hypothetical protein